MNELPYVFDLLYDIKTVEQLDLYLRTRAGWGDQSSILETMRDHDISLPEGLATEEYTATRVIILESRIGGDYE